MSQSNAQTAVNWDSVESAASFYQALNNADEPSFKKEFEHPFLVFVEDPDRNAFSSLNSLAARKSFMKAHFRKMNPNPILDENQLLKEYIARNKIARTEFTMEEPPYLDGRGITYIRYGKPLYRFRDHGGLKTMNLLTVDILDHIYTVPPPRFYVVSPNESWGYENFFIDYVIHFSKEDGVFRQVESLSELISAERSRDRTWYWSELIRERAWISPLLQRTTVKLDQYELSLFTTLASEGAYEDPGTIGLIKTQTWSAVGPPQGKVVENQIKHEIKELNEQQHVPHSWYEPANLPNEIEFDATFSQFRGENSLTQVRIDLVTPVEDNLTTNDGSRKDSTNLRCTALLRDPLFEPVVGTSKLMPYYRSGPENALSQLTLLSGAQTGDLTVQVENPVESRVGFRKIPVSVRDFTGSDLMISDIQFLAPTDDASAAYATAKKSGLLLGPYPFTRIRKTTPLYCYFEVYNLLDGLSDMYDLTFEVYTVQGENTLVQKVSDWIGGSKYVFLSVSHQRKVLENDSEELISIDLSDLEPGEYMFEVSIRNSGEAAARVSLRRPLELTE